MFLQYLRIWIYITQFNTQKELNRISSLWLYGHSDSRSWKFAGGCWQSIKEHETTTKENESRAYCSNSKSKTDAHENLEGDVYPGIYYSTTGLQTRRWREGHYLKTSLTARLVVVLIGCLTDWLPDHKFGLGLWFPARKQQNMVTKWLKKKPNTSKLNASVCLSNCWVVSISWLWHWECMFPWLRRNHLGYHLTSLLL